MNLELIVKKPAGAPRPTPLLFIHGAWHAAWYWDIYFLDYFVAQGYACYAPSLRGHGGSDGRQRLRWTRVKEYVADVAQVAAGLPAPPAIIAHSMGGLVAQHYLARHPAPAAVLMASVPPAGALGTTLRIARRHPLAFLRANLTMSLLPLVETPALAREAFYSAAVPEAEVQSYTGRLQDESYLAFLDMLALARPRPERVTTPLLVLGGTADMIFLPHEVRATAEAYGAEALLFRGLAHNLMLEPAWQQVTEPVVAWLQSRGL